ncbi:MAG: trypsin-like peptidase domain-containing protein [Verrucomicrobiaceae bacterium]|nr:trypsin-like peptidase domain-containing protein [Verrucomicrobiaceae bacterium]
MELVRRLLFAAAMIGIAAMLYSYSRGGREHYGLPDLLRGEKPPADTTGAKLDLDDIQVIRRMSDEFSKLSAVVLPSVVSITTETRVSGRVIWDPFYGLVGQRPQVIPGLGSGAIISPDGLVVTNYHVIEDVSAINVTTNSNAKYPAVVLGADPERDIALLRIESTRKDFPALTFANSDDVRVGQIVFAVGNPFGLSGTVTQGIISARDRHLSDSQMDYLQTDTVINPGNSGGPLVNIHGQIVGVNVAIYRGDENVRAWQGVGLAVPANAAKMVVDLILDRMKQTALDSSRVSTIGHGYLGLEVLTEPVEIAALWGTSPSGALVSGIDPRSPAAAAGLRVGDVITKFQGMSFQTPAGLLETIRKQRPGSSVILQVIRANERREVKAVIGKRPDLQ